MVLMHRSPSKSSMRAFQLDSRTSTPWWRTVPYSFPLSRTVLHSLRGADERASELSEQSSFVYTDRRRKSQRGTLCSSVHSSDEKGNHTSSETVCSAFLRWARTAMQSNDHQAHHHTGCRSHSYYSTLSAAQKGTK